MLVVTADLSYAESFYYFLLTLIVEKARMSLIQWDMTTLANFSQT